MMNKDEAVQKLATAGRLSIAHAEDLYDSFFPKPVVPQYVADWYEGNKRNLDLNLCGLVYDLAMNSTDCYREEFKAWAEGNKKTFITTLVNMHQFGYEVEKEARYIVKFKGVYGDARYLNHEWGAVEEQEGPFHVCMVYADVYEVGQPNLGIAILYNAVNKAPHISC